MVSTGDNWVRIFDVPDTSKHKKGFTLYKVISMLYPENCPDAVTKITVWKRYNDLKKLHREMKLKYRSLNMKEKFPGLPHAPFFKRFDRDIIMERQSAVLHFLDFIASMSELYTSSEFVGFFKTSQTPTEMINSSISSIRAELHLPEEPEYFPFHTPSSDDECTISDTDSVTTLSSCTPSLHADFLSNALYKSSTSLTKLSSTMSSVKVTSSDSNDSLSASTTDSLSTELFSTSTIPLSNVSQYIIDASHHINLATQLEIDKKYEDAFAEYKVGIDVLLRNVKVDKNTDRRELVRFQIERYLLRAEKIYNMHLSSEMKTIKEITEKYEFKEVTKSLSDLYNYKVIKVIGSGMLVIHMVHQKLFYVKVLQKPTKFSHDELILPDNVPYMVKLHNYYVSEHAIFLILDYCSGSTLCDYLKQQSKNVGILESISNTQNNNVSDDESEGSYTDLINEYATIKNAFSLDTTDHCSQILKTNTIKENISKTDEKDSPGVEVGDILEKSQRLLTSVDGVLQEHNEIEEEFAGCVSAQNASSEKSSVWPRREDINLENKLVSTEYVVRWAAQLILAVEKLHALGVICNNLQLKNLLIDESRDLVLTYRCCVSDSQDMFRQNHKLSLAPELYSFKKATKAVDWWSLGTILYELLVGVALKDTHPQGLTYYKIPYIPKYVSAEGRSLLKQLLSFEANERLGGGINGIEDIKAHPFFNSVSWHSMASHCIH